MFLLLPSLAGPTLGMASLCQTLQLLQQAGVVGAQYHACGFPHPLASQPSGPHPGLPAPACEMCCCAPAQAFCLADEAALCLSCDAQLHGSNPVSARHRRVVLWAPPPAWQQPAPHGAALPFEAGAPATSSASGASSSGASSAGGISYTDDGTDALSACASAALQPALALIPPPAVTSTLDGRPLPFANLPLDVDALRQTLLWDGGPVQPPPTTAQRLRTNPPRSRLGLPARSLVGCSAGVPPPASACQPMAQQLPTLLQAAPASVPTPTPASSSCSCSGSGARHPGEPEVQVPPRLAGAGRLDIASSALQPHCQPAPAASPEQLSHGAAATLLAATVDEALTATAAPAPAVSALASAVAVLLAADPGGAAQLAADPPAGLGSACRAAALARYPAKRARRE